MAIHCTDFLEERGSKNQGNQELEIEPTECKGFLRSDLYNLHGRDETKGYSTKWEGGIPPKSQLAHSLWTPIGSKSAMLLKTFPVDIPDAILLGPMDSQGTEGNLDSRKSTVLVEAAGAYATRLTPQWRYSVDTEHWTVELDGPWQWLGGVEEEISAEHVDASAAAKPE